MTKRLSFVVLAAAMLLMPRTSQAGEPPRPTATPAMHTSLERTIDYIEIPTRDLAASKRFFAALFGWHFTDYGPDYASFDDGRTVGGFFTSDKVAAFANGSVLVVFYHGDLEACQAKVQSLGGQITKAAFSFPGGRRFHFTEPGGGEFAVWSDK